MNRIKQQIASFDNLALELYDSLDLVNEQINKKQDTGIPQNLLNQKISLVREIKNIIKEKMLLELDIPVNESVEDIVEEVLAEHAKKLMKP